MAKVRAAGSDIVLLTKDETTYGTAPTGNWTRSVVGRWDGGGAKPLGYEPELGLGPDAQDPYYDPLNLDLALHAHMRFREMGTWLKRLLGAPVTTGSDPYTHVFSSGVAQLPSFGTEEQHPQLTTPVYFLRLGTKLGTLGIELSRSGPGIMEFTGMAQNVSKAGSTAGGTPVAAQPAGKFFNNKLLLKKDGSNLGYATAGRIDFTNNLERVETIGRGDGLVAGIDEGDRVASGNLSFRLTSDLALFDHAMTDEDPFALLFTWTTPAHASWKLDIGFDRVFGSWTQPPVEGPGGITGAFDWRAAKDGSDPMMVVTLVNDLAAY